jgi:hypothetical protein
MARDKVVLWLQRDGTYEDQFGTEKDCTVVEQQVVAKLVDTRTRKGGYDQTVRTYVYEDPLGRTFKKTNDGISYHQGRTYREVGGDREGLWKRPKKFDRNAPYVDPRGEREIEIMDQDHDPRYEFYVSEQRSLL